ncbi:MAG: hypothetical protein H0W69_00085 [Gemmatimonadaceae bacterium]|nr:hypothetical protein [Gemmatimonadaceae bacterium]
MGARVDRSGLVVALYGPWGEGKTSVLHMVREDLRQFSDVVVVDFNPWLFKDADHLVIMFFETLAQVLGKSIQLRTGGESIGSLLRRYGRLLKGVPVVGSAAGEVAQAAGEELGEATLDQLRGRVQEGISSSGKRIVVFIDDIDRLEGSEVRAVMRLVKLTAGFDNTTYVLAFDPRVVSAALVSAVDGSESIDGQRYLEKIVQVPLALPAADPSILLSLMLEHLNASILEIDAEFPDADQQAFLRYLRPLYEARPRTVREGKRYANAAGFALSLLAGEANTGDLLLLEALRTWYPDVHSSIYRFRELFVGDELGRPPLDRGTGNRSTALEAAKLQWAVVTRTLDDLETKAVTQLLEHLFPFVQALTRNTTHGSEWISEWDKTQRAASKNYFDRYFQYSIPRSDVADRTLRSIEALLSAEDINGVKAEVRRHAETGASQRLLEKLSLNVAALPGNSAASLARALAESGDLFSDEGGFLGGWLSTGATAARVVRACVARLGTEARAALLRELVESRAPLRFAISIYEWARSTETQRSKETCLLTDLEEETLRSILGSRLQSEHEREALFCRQPLADRRKSLDWWGRSTSTQNVRTSLSSAVSEDANNAVSIILPFQSHGWIMETGLPTPDQFSHHDYDAVARIADPIEILAAVKRLYGDAIESFDLDSPRTFASEGERVAHHFAYQHGRALQRAAHAESQGPDDGELENE